MGIGIATMHYLGMSALHASAHMNHAPALVAASVAIAIAASGLALWLAGDAAAGRRSCSRPSRSASRSRACTTPPWPGVTFFPHADPPRPRPRSPPTCSRSWSPSWRSWCRRSSCCSWCRIARVAADDRPTKPHHRCRLGCRRPNGTSVPAPASLGRGERIRQRRRIGRGGYAPLGGAGVPPRRLARQLPVERDGGTHFVAVEQWSRSTPTRTTPISSTARQSCSARSHRRRRSAARHQPLHPRPPQPHRQHRPRGRVQARRRQRPDRAAGADRYTVPVSRSRVGWLKTRLAPKVDQAVS